MASKKPKNPVLVDNDNEKITVIDSGTEDTEQDPDMVTDDIQIRPKHVKLIKAIIMSEDQAKFHKETSSALKKTLVEELDVDSSLVSEIINVVRQEQDPEKGGAVERKRRVASAAEQCVVMYDNVDLTDADVAGFKGAVVED